MKISVPLTNVFRFPGSTDGKEFACNAGDLGLIPGSGRWQPTQYACLESSTEEPVGYSPWGHKESDTTEELTLSLFIGFSIIIQPSVT